MMCQRCGGLIAEPGKIYGWSGPWCYCLPEKYNQFNYIKPNGQKCDICGSTATDHTEMQCQINRTLKPRTGGQPNKTKSRHVSKEGKR